MCSRKIKILVLSYLVSWVREYMDVPLLIILNYMYVLFLLFCIYITYVNFLKVKKSKTRKENNLNNSAQVYWINNDLILYFHQYRHTFSSKLKGDDKEQRLSHFAQTNVYEVHNDPLGHITWKPIQHIT